MLTENSGDAITGSIKALHPTIVSDEEAERARQEIYAQNAASTRKKQAMINHSIPAVRNIAGVLLELGAKPSDFAKVYDQLPLLLRR